MSMGARMLYIALIKHLSFNADNTRGSEMRPSLRRSLRRALRSVVKQNLIIRMGAVPAVHTINPALFSAVDERRGKVMATLGPYGFSIEGDALIGSPRYVQSVHQADKCTQ